jgi:protein-L-isoaspartate(D-aspartate) O-methyltransferase
VSDAGVLHAFDVTPRHVFVPSGMRHRAYEDSALPIGNGQTISQPSTHALYLQLLRLGGAERVLEIGTGSGYQTALLSQLAAHVYSVERVAPLADRAREAMRLAEVRNVSLLVGDGTLGWKDYAPFDAIVVTAGAPAVPSPLAQQLADGGRMLIPLGDRQAQTLVLLVRNGLELLRHEIGPARFVPLIGAHGWSQEND